MESVIDINIEIVEYDTEHIFLRATQDEKAYYISQNFLGVTYKAIKVGDKVYIPNNK